MQQRRRDVLAFAALLAASAAGVFGVYADWSLKESVIVPGLVMLLAAVAVTVVERTRRARLKREASQQEAERVALQALAREARAAILQCKIELDAQHAHAEDELQRLEELLNDAVEQLSTSFATLHEVSVHLRGLLQPIVAAVRAGTSGNSAPGLLAGIDAGSEEFDRQMGLIVTALQFQDIATQLVESARLRLQHSQRLAAGFDATAAVLDDSVDQRGGVPVLAQLVVLRQKISELIDHSRSQWRRSTVAATGMAPGTIEMF